MKPLSDVRVIVFKGVLFLLAGILSAGLLLAFAPQWRVAALLAICVWCFCRFYYFAFYVIQHYVDDSFRFAGLGDFAVWLVRGQWRK